MKKDCYRSKYKPLEIEIYEARRRRFRDFRITHFHAYLLLNVFFISLLIAAVEYRLIAKMNEQQLEAAKLHFEELRYGMKNIEVKSLGLRSFCQRKERMNNGVRLGLWSLKPEWLQYVDKHRVLDKISINSEPHTEKQSTDIVSEVSVSDFSSFVQEESSLICSSSKHKPYRSKLEKDVYQSIFYGDCQLQSIFDRIILILCYYNQLCERGMTSREIVQHDLYGMLNNFIVLSKNDNRYRIKPEAQLHIEYLIHKYYHKDINEYIGFILPIYKKERQNRGITILKYMPSYIADALYKMKAEINNAISRAKNHEEAEDIKCTFILNFGCDISEFTASDLDDESYSFNLITIIIKSMDTQLPELNILEKWNSILSNSRIEFIVKLINLSFKSLDSYSEKIGHPMNADLNVFACLYLIVVYSDELGDLELLTSELAYNRIAEIDGKELNAVITAYLQSDEKERRYIK